MVGFFVQLLRVPMGILVTFAMAIVLIGTFSIANDPFDIWLVLGFGILGWIMKRTGFDPGPLVLAFVLGPILEASVRQSLLISGGEFTVFVSDPIAITIYSLLAVGIAFATIRRLTKGRPSVIEQARNIPPATGLIAVVRGRRDAKTRTTTDASADAVADTEVGEEERAEGAPKR